MLFRSQLVYSGAAVFSDKFGLLDYIEPKYRGDCRKYFRVGKGEAVVTCGESSAIFTRRLYDQLGGFDEALSYGSGWDFFRRAAELTFFDFINEPLVAYRQHESNMSHKVNLAVRETIVCHWKIVTEDKLSVKENAKMSLRLFSTVIKTYLKAIGMKLCRTRR